MLDPAETFGQLSELASGAQTIFALLGWAGAVAAGLWAVYTFRVSQRWKRLEFTAAQVERFNRDPTTQICKILLDFSACDLFVAQTVLDDACLQAKGDEWLTPLESGATLRHSRERLARLLSRTDDSAPTPDSERLLYHIADGMLGWMEHFVQGRKSKLMDPGLVQESIGYWTEAMVLFDASHAAPDDTPGPFQAYLTRYRYSALLAGYEAAKVTLSEPR